MISILSFINAVVLVLSYSISVAVFWVWPSDNQAAIVDEERAETKDSRKRMAPTERGVPVSVYLVEE